MIGGTSTGAITEDDSAATLTTSGSLSITDTDSGEARFDAATVSGTYGSLSIDASGSWTYSANNTETVIQALGSGDTLTETLQVIADDGTIQDIVITINGTNDAAVIGGTSTGAITEDDSASTLTTSGSLIITDTDSGEARFDVTTVSGTYGSLSIDASGSWTYSADNTETAIQTLGSGETLTETIQVTADDGTIQDIVITINGTNDAAVIGGTSTGAITEDDSASTLTTSGSLTITDTDSGEARFDVTTVSGTYGSLSIDASGSWTYSANNTETAIQELGSGETLTETLQVTADDGTTQDIVITINGTNDAAVIGGTSTGAITEDDSAATLTTSGSLSITDTDSGEARFDAATVSGTYGSLSIDASGSWTYSANNTETVIQELGSGETLTETLQVTADDGTTQDIVITINGVNDGANVGAAIDRTTNEDTSFVITQAQLLANATDAEGDTLFVSSVSVASGQIAVVDNGDSTWTVSPADNWSGSAQLSFDISDGTTTTASQVNVTVTPDADAPTITGAEQLTLLNFDGGALAAGWTTTRTAEIARASVYENVDSTDYGNNNNYVSDLDTGDGDAADALNYTVSMTSGYDHEVTFQLRQRDSTSGGGVETNNVEVVWNGEVLQTINPPDSWQTYTIRLPARVGNGNGVLTFREPTDGDDDDYGALFDDVSVSRVSEISTYNNTQIDFDPGIVLTDADSSETLTVSISGVPSGVTIGDGSNTATSDGTDIDVSSWDLSELRVSPTGDIPNFTITVSATSTESSGNDTETVSQAIQFNLEDDPDVMTVDGSTVISYTNFDNGLPAGWSSVNGVQSFSDGGAFGTSRTGTRIAELDNAGTGDPDSYYYDVDTSRSQDHQLSLWVKERSGAAGSDEIEVVWNNQVIQTIDPGTSWEEVIITLPDTNLAATRLELREVSSQNNGWGALIDELTLSRVTTDDSNSGYDSILSVSEDTPFNLNITTSSGETVTVAGIPIGFTLTDGTNTVTTTGSDVNVSSWDLSNLTVTPAANHDTDFDITLTSADTSAGTVDTTVIRVDVEGVQDAAVITGDSTGAVTEDDTILAVTGSLNVTDVDSGESNFTATTVTGGYGSLTIDASGSWSYSANNSESAIQSLGTGDTLTETITVASADGTTQDIVITINGINDAAVISGTSTGTMTEDDSATTLTTSGLLNITDTDSGEARFDAATVSGTYGSLTIDVSGSWTYSADNTETAIQALGSGDTLTETIQITADDGSIQGIVITISGINDVAVIGGASTGTITEDDSAATLSVTGSLSITDTDSGEASFDVATVSGTYGSLSIDASGSWTYSADNTDTAIQALGSGDTLTETLQVTAEDGTTQDIVITINGANDAPDVGASITVSANEDSSFTLTSAQLLANASDSEGDTLTVSNLTSTSTNITITENNGLWTITPDPDWSGSAALNFTISDGSLTTTGTANATVNAVADTPQLYVSAILQSEVPAVVTGVQSFATETEGVAIDLASNDPQVVVTGASRLVYDVNNVTGSAHDDTFSFSNPSNGDVYTIDGGAGNNILDLSEFAASDVNLTETSAIVSISETESFTINYSNIGSVRFDSSTTDGDPHRVTFGEGDWTAQGTTLTVRNLAYQQHGIALIDYEGSLSENFTLSTTVTAHDSATMLENGYIVFDYQDANNYKVVRAHIQGNRWTIREVSDGVETELTRYSTVLDADTPVTVTMRATGGLVEIVDGETVLARHDFGSPVNGGRVGVGARNSNTDFVVNLQPDNWAPDLDDLNLVLDVADTSITTPNVLAEARDEEGDTLSISSFTQGSNGSVTQNADGTFTYIPNSDFTGVDTFTYVISDGANTTTGEIRVVVTDSHTVEIAFNSGSPVDIDIAAAVMDMDGSETLAVTLSGIANGVQISDGTNTFTATANSGSVNVTAWDLDDIVLTPPTTGEEDFNLVVTATTTDGASTATNSSTINFRYVLAGTSDDDTLTGTSDADRIEGLAGADTLSGGAGNDILRGGEGNDILLGEGDDDILIGGAGNDTLTGGSGSNTFRWGADDGGTSSDPAVDVITDFTTGSGGDVLDISDILVGEDDTGSSLDDYLHFTFANGDTTIELSSTANGPVTQKITLEDVDLSSLGGSDEAIITNLLNNGNIQADSSD